MHYVLATQTLSAALKMALLGETTITAFVTIQLIAAMVTHLSLTKIAHVIQNCIAVPWYHISKTAERILSVHHPPQVSAAQEKISVQTQSAHVTQNLIITHAAQLPPISLKFPTHVANQETYHAVTGEMMLTAQYLPHAQQVNTCQDKVDNAAHMVLSMTCAAIHNSTIALCAENVKSEELTFQVFFHSLMALHLKPLMWRSIVKATG